jgi:hypothetical protein
VFVPGVTRRRRLRWSVTDQNGLQSEIGKKNAGTTRAENEALTLCRRQRGGLEYITVDTVFGTCQND